METTKANTYANTSTGYQLSTFPNQIPLDSDSVSETFQKSQKSGKINNNEIPLVKQAQFDSHPSYHINGEIPLESVIISSTIACKNSQQQIERIVAAFNEGVDTSRVYQVDPV
ncbi:hypothetical protein M1146_06495 [Patescibacteria group bacterium]|nr:hypothetical protein [Patescibacteria group bacterium]